MWPDPSETELPRKEFIKHYDHLYLYGVLNPDILPYMNVWQQHAMRELYRAQNRMKNNK